MSGRQRLCVRIAKAIGGTRKRPHLRRAEKASWVRVMRDEVYWPAFIFNGAVFLGFMALLLAYAVWGG
jgi:hypothetical protein